MDLCIYQLFTHIPVSSSTACHDVVQLAKIREERSRGRKVERGTSSRALQIIDSWGGEGLARETLVTIGVWMELSLFPYMADLMMLACT